MRLGKKEVRERKRYKRSDDREARMAKEDKVKWKQERWGHVLTGNERLLLQENKES